MSLYSLPNEILDEVCQQFASINRSLTLLAVCLTSRRFSEVGFRNLYSTLDLRSDRRKLGVTLTLMRREELGAHVRTLRVAASTYDRPDDIIHFFLSIMPNLREAHIGVWAPSTLLNRLGDMDSCPAGLRNLSTLYLYRGEGMDLLDIAACLLLPSLEKLSLRSVYDTRDPDETFEFLAPRFGTSNISEIEFELLELFSGRALEAVLKVPKTIRRLSVEPLTCSVATEVTILEISPIVRGLERSRDSLTYLSIISNRQETMQVRYPSFPPDWLPSFSALEELRVHWSMLTTKSESVSQSVSHSLRHLMIHWESNGTANTRAFIRMLRTSRPKALESVCIHGDCELEPATVMFSSDAQIGSQEDELALALGATCREIGVNLKDERGKVLF